MVSIDGELQPLDSDGMLSIYMKRGQHSFTIQCAGYAPINETFTLGTEKLRISKQLESVMAQLSVTCATTGAQIYVNDVLRGTGSWTGNLNPGEYLVEARLSGYYSNKQNITLATRETQTLTIPALTGRYGKLNVDYKPIDCEVWLDGKKLGTSPDVFSNVLMGSHEVEIRKSGYGSEKQSITIEEGQTFALTGTLKQTQSSVASSGSIGGSGAVAQSSAASREGIGGSGAATETFTVNGVTFNMVRVEGGTFTMGATSEQGWEANSDEKPTHRVTLSSYYIGRTEVTQALWKAVMGYNPSKFKGDNLPVEQVSWDDCQIFIRKLNAATGKNFRLPTEAEWEYAARGGDKSQGYKYSGGNTIGNMGWYGDNSGSKTHAVATKRANELGLYDMSGNVWEWCSDWYGDYSSASQTNPTGPTSGRSRVNRGGSWHFSARGCRVSYRGYSTPGYRFNILGLRLALSE